MNASLGGKNTGSTVCEAIDADGNKRVCTENLSSGVVVMKSAQDGA